MTALALLTVWVTALAESHPRLVASINWLNPIFTGIALTIDLDLTLKVLAFLFVTLPLGIVQWGNAVKFIKERRAKKNVQRD